MKLVVVESPYKGNIRANKAYARACVKDCLKRGESPYASHIFFTQKGILDDSKPEERKRGMEAGFAWGAKADLVAVYIDLGVTDGMKDGIEAADLRGTPVEYRSLDGQVSKAAANG